MLNSFCAAANIKGYLQRSDCPPLLKRSIPIIEQCLDHGRRVILAKNARTLLDNDEVKKLRHSDIDWSKQRPLDDSLFKAMKAYIGGESPPRDVFFHSRHDIRGRTYTTQRVSERNSNIFFQPERSEKLIPGIIQEIFAIPIACAQDQYTYDFYFAVQRLLPLEIPPLSDPFSQFPDFGAVLWSDKLENDLEIVSQTQLIQHSISRPWDRGVLVLKPLDRVRI
jgi:hypothetical protein